MELRFFLDTCFKLLQKQAPFCVATWRTSFVVDWAELHGMGSVFDFRHCALAAGED